MWTKAFFSYDADARTLQQFPDETKHTEDNSWVIKSTSNVEMRTGFMAHHKRKFRFNVHSSDPKRPLIRLNGECAPDKQEWLSALKAGEQDAAVAEDTKGEEPHTAVEVCSAVGFLRYYSAFSVDCTAAAI